MSRIGYARVSTTEGRQVLDRQLDALREAGCERIFEDHVSGAAVERPNLAACIAYLREDDVLVVLDLDRLGRRAGEFIALIDERAQRGVGFRALNTPMDAHGHHHPGGPPLRPTTEQSVPREFLALPRLPRGPQSASPVSDQADVGGILVFPGWHAPPLRRGFRGRIGQGAGRS